MLNVSLIVLRAVVIAGDRAGADGYVFFRIASPTNE
jgi:hypothetical protein